MALKIRSQKDFNAGLMFIGFGAMFLIVAAGIPGIESMPGYPMGTAVRMGPAYFPTILGGLLVLLGIIVTIEGLVEDDEPPKKTNWKPLLWILASVIIFAALIGPAGIVVATLALVLIAAYGGHEFRLVEMLIEATVLAIAVVLIFSYGLGLPFRLFPWS